MYKALKDTLPSVETFRVLNRVYGNRTPHCEETEHEELSGCCHLLMSGSQDEGASAAGVLTVRVCSVRCVCSLISVTSMGAAWSNTMRVFFFSLTYALKRQDTLDLHPCCLALLTVDVFIETN